MFGDHIKEKCKIFFYILIVIFFLSKYFVKH